MKGQCRPISGVKGAPQYCFGTDENGDFTASGIFGISVDSTEDSGHDAASSGDCMSIFGIVAGVDSVLPVEDCNGLETRDSDTKIVHWLVATQLLLMLLPLHGETMAWQHHAGLQNEKN